jgi:cell division protein ZapA (FtsZ GTPase activity inhibitor)
MDNISISIQVVNKTYKLKIPAGSEEQLRAHVKQVNDCAGELKQHFAGLEDFDYLAMSVVQVFSGLAASETAVSPQEAIDRAQKILSMLKS